MKKLLFLAIILLAVACQSESKRADFAKTEQAASEEAMVPPSPPQDERAPASPLPARKIIKTARLRMEVKNLETSTAQIRRLVGQLNGFVSNLNLSNSNYELNSEITIKVPSDKFQELLDSIKHQAVFLEYEQIHTNDVTEEYHDLQTRLKTKKEVRDRYVDILRNKAKTVKDVLLAEDKIRVIQEEIEAAEGRLKFLSAHVSLSTITVNLFQKIEFKPSPKTYTNTFRNRLGRSFKNGLVFIEELILGLISIWPLLLIFGLLFGFRKRIFRRFRG